MHNGVLYGDDEMPPESLTKAQWKWSMEGWEEDSNGVVVPVSISPRRPNTSATAIPEVEVSVEEELIFERVV